METFMEEIIISVNFWQIQNASWQVLAYMQCNYGEGLHI